ncbi:hypothetical protein BCT86_00115 [Vibrio breoganii]|uniref:oligosaccharide flippase family protein n=1 Tax=Vibrio breoganii TaxID=553239 RepID=UPI000C862126|nr:oligosaccharide flippase family protein [Vibrio breoganii]PML10619.1 hypothetical protein BCT86_00115 [Vibrio breoganii]
MLKEIKKNIFKSMISKYALYLLNIGSLVIYMRLFQPEDFGVIALVGTITTFFMLLGEVGIGSALITKKELSNSQRNGIFTFTFLLGSLIALGIYISLYLMNQLFPRDDFDIVGLYAVFACFFSIINSVPNASLINDNKYYRLSFHNFISEAVSFLLVLILYKFFEIPGEIILGVRIAFGRLLVLVCNILYSKHTSFGNLSINRDFTGLRVIKSFSLNLLGFNFLNYFSRNLDNLLIGKYFGLASLGVYEKAYVLMRYPLMLISQAASVAIQPTLTKTGYNTEEAKIAYNFISETVLFIGFIIAGLMYCNSQLIVDILFGEKWAEVSQIIGILALSVPIQLVTSFNGGFWQAADFTQKQFKVSIVNAIIFIPTIISSVLIYSELTYIVMTVTILLIITCSYAYISIRRHLFCIDFKISIFELLFKYSLFLTLIFTYEIFESNNAILNLISTMLISFALCIVYFREELSRIKGRSR